MEIVRHITYLVDGMGKPFHGATLPPPSPQTDRVSIRSWNGAPSQKGCVVNGQVTKTRNKGVRPAPDYSDGGNNTMPRSRRL